MIANFFKKIYTWVLRFFDIFIFYPKIFWFFHFGPCIFPSYHQNFLYLHKCPNALQQIFFGSNSKFFQQCYEFIEEHKKSKLRLWSNQLQIIKRTRKSKARARQTQKHTRNTQLNTNKQESNENQFLIFQKKNWKNKNDKIVPNWLIYFWTTS